ncbi:Ig-like domain-containing protein [Kitasatospora sp. NPDC056446]|uniref:Ig-like domain-containing protein n=1 Tax=Kitasatospora sp. NPDC056446 TaxID=3345819 RepID=UPI0036A9DB26
MNRQLPRTAAALVVLTTGLLAGWNAPPTAAQQSPDAWSAEHRAVLPSGLSARIDFDASPGVGVTAGSGELADRSGGGRPAALYADGMHPGDSAQTFELAQDRPQTDGSWRTTGTLRLTFSRPVRNPRLHLSGLAALATGKSGTTATAARLTLTGGSPAAPVLVNRTDWPGWTVDGNTLAPTGRDGASDGAPGSAAEGSLELAGTFRTAVFRVEQRSTARAGSTTAPPVLRQAYTVTVDEDLGTAPQAYGNASHIVSDLFLGADAADPSRRARERSAGAVGDEPLIRLDHGAALRSPFAGPPPPKLQPGRGEYQGADPSLGFPTEAAIGRYYRLTVPVAVGDQPATLAGWIDFAHTGRFEPAERVQTEVPAGADTATLEWTVPAGAASGETWARLRIGRDTSQLVSSGGFADSGQVSDQRIKLAVGASRPEIAEPVDGSVLSDARPEISGEGAVAGATVEVREDDSAICKAKVVRGGAWSCRPAAPLTAGRHSFTPVETTSGGVVLRGEAVKVTVKTAPPAAPALTLPAYTNDPGLQLTGTGDAGSTVSVTDRSPGGELCSTAVPPGGEWSCLPVENLADGKHLLTPVAVDGAGNRTTGQPVTLTVDTVPPDRPVLGSPAPGETLRVSRPKLAGRAEPGSNVLVTAASAPGSDQRTVLCGTTAALDGSWSCTANRDLTDGDQWLTVTATDPAGNGTSAEPVRVRVATAAAVPTSGATASAVPSPVASSPAVSSPAMPSSVASSSVAPSPVVPSPVASASASVVAGPSAAASGSAPASASASASVSASAVPSPAASASEAVPSPAAPEVPVLVPVPPGVLPIPVPPVVAAPVVTPPVTPSPVKSDPSAASSGSAKPSPSASPSPGRVSSPSVGEVPVLPVTVPPVTVRPVAPAPTAVPSGAGKPGPVASVASTPPTPPTPPAPSASPASSASSASATSVVPTAPTAVTASASATATATAPPTPAAVATTGGPSPAEPAEPAEAVGSAERVARPLPVPPAETSPGASGRPGETGWRGGVAGILLVLTGIGLITRRVFARVPGARRR